MSLLFLEIAPSEKATKKLKAIFLNTDTGRTKTVHFGAAGYEDFTTHKDEARKERYLKRHKNKEDWNDPITPGALSRWILWNKPTLAASIKDYKERFWK